MELNKEEKEVIEREIKISAIKDFELYGVMGDKTLIKKGSIIPAKLKIVNNLEFIVIYINGQPTPYFSDHILKFFNVEFYKEEVDIC